MIGQHEFAAIDVEYAELRMQGGEGIIGDLRLRGADGGEEGRLAGVRQPDETRVRDQFQPQPDLIVLRRAGRGWRGAARDWSRT